MRIKKGVIFTSLFVLSLCVVISVFPLSAKEKQLTPEFEEAYINITKSLGPDQLAKATNASKIFMKNAKLFTEGADFLLIATNATEQSGFNGPKNQKGVKYVLAHGAKVITEDIGEIENASKEITIVKSKLMNYIKNIDERIKQKGGVNKGNLGKVKGYAELGKDLFQSKRSKNFNVEYFTASNLKAPRFLGRKDVKDLLMLKSRYEAILKKVEEKAQKADSDLKNMLDNQSKFIQLVMNTVRNDRNIRHNAIKNIR